MDKKVLCVGLLNLDIIQTCKSFPVEDSDQRCVDHRWQRGGNASNNSTVLSKLGLQVEFLGTICKDRYYDFMKNDLDSLNIDTKNCPVNIENEGPTSVVILAESTGTRTIMHYNPGMPEVTMKDFEKLNLADYQWIHFEGRNVSQVKEMMTSVEYYNKKATEEQKITVSVELEKGYGELTELIGLADVVFIGKDYATFRGHPNMRDILRNEFVNCREGATLICAWGERGAMARVGDGQIFQSPAYPPPTIKDSLGAGDTFVATAIYCLIKNKSVKTTLFFACKVAGFKCGIKGYHGIEEFIKKLDN